MTQTPRHRGTLAGERVQKHRDLQASKGIAAASFKTSRIGGCIHTEKDLMHTLKISFFHHKRVIIYAAGDSDGVWGPALGRAVGRAGRQQPRAAGQRGSGQQPAPAAAQAGVCQHDLFSSTAG